MTTYQFAHSDNSLLVDVLPFESNGLKNLSTPRPIFGFDRSLSDCDVFIIDGDYTSRFVVGFEFDIVGNTPLDGHYIVCRNSWTLSNQTFIPVDEIPEVSVAFPPSSPTVINAVSKKAQIVYQTPIPATSLKLQGHGTSRFNETITWGNAIQQNMIALLENFASDSAPLNPIPGQLWYHKSSQQLFLYHGKDIEWKPLCTTETMLHAMLDQRYIRAESNNLFNMLSLLSQPTESNHVTTKQYVDSFVNGVIWKTPILDPNLFDDSLSSPPSEFNEQPYNRTFIVSNGEQEWAPFSGHAVQYTGTEWVSVLNRPVATGDRFGIYLEPEDQALALSPAGGLAGRSGQIATVISVSPLIYTFEVPVEPDAVAVVRTRTGGSYFAGRGYTFRGLYGLGNHGPDYRWIEFVFSPPPQPLPLVPANCNAPGKPGDMIADDEYLYVYGTTGWRRIPSLTF